jgi:hypothetical protein
MVITADWLKPAADEYAYKPYHMGLAALEMMANLIEAGELLPMVDLPSRKVLSLAEEGRACVFISSELEEVLRPLLDRFRGLLGGCSPLVLVAHYSAPENVPRTISVLKSVWVTTGARRLRVR